MGKLDGKVAVVTGGNSGIGKAIAKKLDEQGAYVTIFGRDQQRLDQTVSEMKRGTAALGDVRNLKDLESLFKSVGKLDILVANAGVGTKCLLDDVDEAFFDKLVETNYKGLFFTMKYAAPLLNNGGSVVLISSIAAHRGVTGHSVYCSTKAAVSSLAKCFASEYAKRKIRVNAISPGYIDTPIFDEILKVKPTILSDAAERIALKRIGQPDEIADGVLYLCSDGSYVTGTDLVIDGGLINCV